MIGMASVIAVTLSARNTHQIYVVNCAQGNFCAGCPTARVWQVLADRDRRGQLLPAKRDSPKQNWPKHNWSKRNTPKCN